MTSNTNSAGPVPSKPFKNVIAGLARALDRAGIPYMVIGGQAVQLYGTARFTDDVDFTIALPRKQVSKVLRICARAGLVPVDPDPAGKVAIFSLLITEHAESGIGVDFQFAATTFEEQAMRRAVPRTVARKKVKYVAVEDLIVQKIIAGRPQDLKDVKGILLKKPDIDFQHIRQWIREFEVALGESFLPTLERVMAEAQR